MERGQTTHGAVRDQLQKALAQWEAETEAVKPIPAPGAKGKNRRAQTDAE